MKFVPIQLAQPMCFLTAFLAVIGPRAAWADVAPLPPPLKTVLPEPFQVVAIGLGLSVLFVLLGSRLVAKGKWTRTMLNTALFLIGMLTAITAVYSKKLRLDYKAEVERARESYRSNGPVREPIEEPNIDPPNIDPPNIDPPDVDPPNIDPPDVDPPNEGESTSASNSSN